MQNEFCVRYVFKHVTCEHVLLADSTFHTYTLVIRRSVSYKGTQVVLWNFERVNFFGGISLARIIRMDGTMYAKAVLRGGIVTTARTYGTNKTICDDSEGLGLVKGGIIILGRVES